MLILPVNVSIDVNLVENKVTSTPFTDPLNDPVISLIKALFTYATPLTYKSCQ